MLIDDAPPVFTLARDPDDAHYIDLAIAANALYVVSRDKDLLDLMRLEVAGAEQLSRVHPHPRILDPVAFLLLVQA